MKTPKNVQQILIFLMNSPLCKAGLPCRLCSPLCSPVYWPIEVYPSIRHGRALRFRFGASCLIGTASRSFCPRAALNFVPPCETCPNSPLACHSPRRSEKETSRSTSFVPYFLNTPSKDTVVSFIFYSSLFCSVSPVTAGEMGTSAADAVSAFAFCLIEEAVRLAHKVADRLFIPVISNA